MEHDISSDTLDNRNSYTLNRRHIYCDAYDQHGWPVPWQLTPPMHEQESYSITRNCLITRQFPTPSRNSTNKYCIYYLFVFPETQWSVFAYYLLSTYYKMHIFRIHMNFWFSNYRSAKFALKLVQKLDRDKQSKMFLQFSVFTPCKCRLNFENRLVRSPDIKVSREGA